MKSLAETYKPASRCFGCGPANEKGLHLRSFPEGDGCVAEFRAEPHHEAFPGVLNGGIIGTLFDCHSAWTATWVLHRAAPDKPLPSVVTANFHVTLRRPAPSRAAVTLRAKVVEQGQDWAVVEATLESGGKLCATCRGRFVAVKEGHPAFSRAG